MLIGIDVGGTKNDLVLCDNSGRVLNRLLAPGSNAADVGAEVSARRIAEQTRLLMKDWPEATVEAMYAGLSGGGAARIRAAVHGILVSELPFIRKIDNASDALNGLYACVGTHDGMVVIAGTGTSAFVRRGQALTQVGGWGYLVDDAGSGFWIGKAVLNAAFRAFDGRGPQTLLAVLAERQLNSRLPDAIPAIYQGGKRMVASFAPLAFEAADAGDEAALAIADAACRELALLISTCASHLSEPPYRVALSGSLWKAPRLREGVKKALSADYLLLSADLPPVYGAAVAAAALAGFPAEKSFHDAFAESFMNRQEVLS